MFLSFVIMISLFFLSSPFAPSLYLFSSLIFLTSQWLQTACVCPCLAITAWSGGAAWSLSEWIDSWAGWYIIVSLIWLSGTLIQTPGFPSILVNRSYRSHRGTPGCLLTHSCSFLPCVYPPLAELHVTWGPFHLAHVTPKPSVRTSLFYYPCAEIWWNLVLSWSCPQLTVYIPRQRGSTLAKHHLGRRRRHYAQEFRPRSKHLNRALSLHFWAAQDFEFCDGLSVPLNCLLGTWMI